MLGDSITITLGGTGGTAKVLNKINQDAYGAVYLLREATQEFEMKVSHSKNGTRDRHYVEVKQTIFAAVDGDPDTVYTASQVVLAAPREAAADVTDLSRALSFYLDDDTIMGKILGWES